MHTTLHDHYIISIRGHYIQTLTNFPSNKNVFLDFNFNLENKCQLNSKQASLFLSNFLVATSKDFDNFSDTAIHLNIYSL